MTDDRVSLDELAGDGLFDLGSLSWPKPCGHCGRTSHGFACCGLLFADEPGGCPCSHDLEAAKPPHRAPVKGQSGPPKPIRAPRRIDPRRSR